jgi:hypothetical protein
MKWKGSGDRRDKEVRDRERRFKKIQTAKKKKGQKHGRPQDGTAA